MANRPFLNALDRADIVAATDLFTETCFWRDLLTFTWNIKTVEGRAEIADLLAARLDHVRPANWRIEGEPSRENDLIQAWFTFDTAVARGRGLFRLTGNRCSTLLTTMTELIGHEEPHGRTRPQGVRHKPEKGRKFWTELRAAHAASFGIDTQPYCLVIGAGQGGIALGARLRRLGVPTLIIEKNQRAGDSWRNRYRSLVLHDPVWYDHLPYLPFPDDWPVFTPKDKMGDWLEHYAGIMELDIWTATECTGAAYDETTGEWRVQVNRDGEQSNCGRSSSSSPPAPMAPQKSSHSTGLMILPVSRCIPAPTGMAKSFVGRHASVIGSGTSGHDVAVDLWEHGADVTMIQRSPSIIIRSETLMELGFGPLYSEAALENGITTDKADLLFASIPYRLLPDVQRPLYEEIARVDADFYRRLAASGFLFDFGADGSGLMAKALRTASGYYIDVGASGLIIDGEIKLKAGAEITRIGPDRLHFADGSELPADVIVHATGYGFMDEIVAKLISPEVARKIGRFWGYGSGTPGDPGPWEGELRNMWKPTKQESLWFHGGNLHLSRHYSLYVALQIKARMEKIETPIYW